jgi:two-component system response regulator MprA
MNQHILIVEDDRDLAEAIRDLLQIEGYLVKIASDGAQALQSIQRTEPDLLLLDLGLPNITGEAVCREVKKQYPDIPIVMLTGKSSSSDVVHGLSVGADDYVTKPFETQELIARVKARLRKNQPDDARYTVDDLVLDTKTLTVKRGATELSLSPQEYKILSYLMANKERVLTREMILSRLWRNNPDIETRVVDVYIGYLRKKIDYGRQKQLIRSVRGFGYKISDSV